MYVMARIVLKIPVRDLVTTSTCTGRRFTAAATPAYISYSTISTISDILCVCGYISFRRYCRTTRSKR